MINRIQPGGFLPNVEVIVLRDNVDTAVPLHSLFGKDERAVIVSLPGVDTGIESDDHFFSIMDRHEELINLGCKVILISTDKIKALHVWKMPHKEIFVASDCYRRYGNETGLLMQPKKSETTLHRACVIAKGGVVEDVRVDMNTASLTLTHGDCILEKVQRLMANTTSLQRATF